jgi:hypothetical protein
VRRIRRIFDHLAAQPTKIGLAPDALYAVAPAYSKDRNKVGQKKSIDTVRVRMGCLPRTVLLHVAVAAWTRLGDLGDLGTTQRFLVRVLQFVVGTRAVFMSVAVEEAKRLAARDTHTRRVLRTRTLLRVRTVRTLACVLVLLVEAKGSVLGVDLWGNELLHFVAVTATPQVAPAL